MLRRHLGPEDRPHGRSQPPPHPLAHQLAWTGPVPALAGQTEEAVRPILRHQDADLYYRDRFDTIGIGYYGHRPMPISADDILSFDEADTAGGCPRC